MCTHDSLVMPEDPWKATATMIRGMHLLFRDIKDVMIYFEDILIGNQTHRVHINTMRAVIIIEQHDKEYFNNHKC